MRWCFLCFLLVFSIVLGAEEIVLFQNGKAEAAIVISADAVPTVKFAATELAHYLKKMTGADFPVVNAVPEHKNVICLGMKDGSGFAEDEFVISGSGNRIDIYGRDGRQRVDFFNLFYDNPDKGTLRGVYNFLDMLGVRWVAPGDRFDYVPKKTRLAFPRKNIRIKPHFADRQIADVWSFIRIYPDAKEYVSSIREVFLWGIRNNASTRRIVAGCHTERVLKLWESPQWLAQTDAHQLMKNGKRNPKYSCWTSPVTREIWFKAADGYFSGKSPEECGFALKGFGASKWPVPYLNPDEFMIDPMDHGQSNDGRCYCRRCQDFRKKHPCSDDSEILWAALADIAGRIGKKYPGKYISTLVYPPKSNFPRSVKLPRNIRVRICMDGAKELNFPNRYKLNADKLKQWSRTLDARIPLWTYQCVTHGRFLPGVPEFYPGLTARFIREIKPWSMGVSCENHSLTHTFRNMDVYIFMRMMWDPERDVAKELDEYCRIFFGPAAVPARKLFAAFEQNWNKLDKLIRNDDLSMERIGLAPDNKEELQKIVWSRVYTRAEVERLKKLLAEMRQLAAPHAEYARRVGMVQKYLFDILEAERRELMEKEEMRQGINVSVAYTDSGKFPAAAQWKKVPVKRLISADRINKTMNASAEFQLLHNRKMLFIRVRVKDAAIAQSRTLRSRKSGNEEMWKDNCLELFLYSVKSKKFWQLAVNDNNAWSGFVKGRVLIRQQQMPGAVITSRRSRKGYNAEFSIPLKELAAGDGELRFNLCMERNVGSDKTQYATFSPLSMLGNWHDVDTYATLNLEK